MSALTQNPRFLQSNDNIASFQVSNLYEDSSAYACRQDLEAIET